MNVLKAAVIGITALAVATPALAQETRVDRRQERQEQRIDQGIQMTSRDSFVSDASVAFFNSTAPNGVAPYFIGCALASGVRFE